MPNWNRLAPLVETRPSRSLTVRSALSALAVLLPLATAACVTGAGNLRQTDHLSREELLEAPATNLYQAIELLRPLWLRTRSTRSVNIDTEIIVVVNGTYYGTEGSLVSISPNEVERVLYEAGGSGATAVGRLGAGRHIDAVIFLEMYNR